MMTTGASRDAPQSPCASVMRYTECDESCTGTGQPPPAADIWQD
jgi:hypothetical protein